MNAAEQYIKLLDVDSFKRCIAIENMKGQGQYRTAKDDNGSKKMVNLKYIENIQITLKMLAKVRVFNISFRKNEQGDLLVLLAC